MVDARLGPLGSLLLVTLVLLAGCNPLLPAPEPAPELFDFGPLPPPAEAAEPLATVRLQALRGPSWLAGPRIPYRQLHRQPEAIRHYARHAWVAPPVELLQQRLEHRLVTDRLRSDAWQLEVDLLNFEQVFVTEDRAYAEINLRATLRERRGQGHVHSRTFRLEETVVADVRGAVSGLPRVADAALAELLAWVSETVAE